MSELTACESYLSRTAHLGPWRLASFGLGTALLVTSVGLWAFASADAVVMLIKLGASIAFLGGSAFFLLLAIGPQENSHLEFDPSTQVFRVTEKDETGRFYVQESHALADMDKLRFEAGALRAWDAEGRLLMSVPMRARSARVMMKAILAFA